MKVNALSALAGVVGSLSIAAVATAGFTGLSVEMEEAGVFRLYANFDDAGDTVVNVFNSNISNAGGWKHDDVAGGTWIPLGAGGPGDSFVTIGGEPSFTNTTTLDPNFDNNTANQTSLGVNAGWFNGNPPNNQGNAGVEGKVLLARFVHQTLDDTVGGLELTFTTAAGDTVFGGGDFTTNPVPAPGALALLGLAGLAGTRRRRG
jgi:MYXO-CTERM domain-containing protein